MNSNKNKEKANLLRKVYWCAEGAAMTKQFLCTAPHKERTSWDFCSCFKVCYCFWAVCHFLKVVIIGFSHPVKHQAQYLYHERLEPAHSLPTVTLMQFEIQHVRNSSFSNSLTCTDTRTPITLPKGVRNLFECSSESCILQCVLELFMVF